MYTGIIWPGISVFIVCLCPIMLIAYCINLKFSDSCLETHVAAVCISLIYGPVHEMLILIAHVKSHPLTMYVKLYSGARDLDFSLSLHLRPYFVFACRIGTGKTAHMHSLI